MLEMRKCEIYPAISGYHDMRGRYEGGISYIAHGNQGCEIWFRRFVDISRTGEMWALNEEGRHIGIMTQEEGFRQLTRTFGRYKKIRIEALN